MDTRNMNELAGMLAEEKASMENLKSLLVTPLEKDSPMQRLAEHSDELAEDLSEEEKQELRDNAKPMTDELAEAIRKFKETLPKGKSPRFYKRAIQRKFGIVEY